MSETTAAFATTALSGYELLADPQFNKGTAFSESEREAFDLHGLLPPNVATLDEQVSRRLQALRGFETDLDSRVFGSDGNFMPGLYAAGEAAGFGGGGMHGYRSLEGTFLGGCLFSGRNAGRAATKAVA